MSGTTRFIRSYDATGRLKSGLLSGSEELRRHIEGREGPYVFNFLGIKIPVLPSYQIPEAVTRPFSIVYNRLFQPWREAKEVKRLQGGHYNILPPEERELYGYPLDRAGAAISFCAYRYHPIKHSISMHTGIDISTQHQNWPVLSTAPGRVSQAFHEKDPRNITPEFGNFVIIKHLGREYLLPLSSAPQEDHFTVDNLLLEGMTNDAVAEEIRQSMKDNPTLQHYMRFSSLYGHLEEFSPDINEWIQKRPERSLIEDGPRVDKGSYLGLSGTTGYRITEEGKQVSSSESEHLHFEIIADVLRRHEDPSLTPYHVGPSCVVNPGKLVIIKY